MHIGHDDIAPIASDLPDHVVHHILLELAGPHEDLLRHQSVCARVCTDWWRVVACGSVYGMIFGDRTLWWGGTEPGW